MPPTEKVAIKRSTGNAACGPPSRAPLMPGCCCRCCAASCSSKCEASSGSVAPSKAPREAACTALERLELLAHGTPVHTSSVILTMLFRMLATDW